MNSMILGEWKGKHGLTLVDPHNGIQEMWAWFTVFVLSQLEIELVR